VSDASLAHIARLRRLEYLGLADTRITDSGLKHVENLSGLNDLILWKTAISDEGLVHLAGLTQLGMLSLDETSITSAGLARLATLDRLTWLCLQRTAVDDRAIGQLAAMPALTDLFVSGAAFSGPGLLKLHERLPSCQIQSHSFRLNSMTIGGAPSDRWQQLVTRIHALDAEDRIKLVDLSGTLLSDEQAAMLEGLQTVECLDLRGTRVTEAGLLRLQQALPRCEIYR
jgi:hypothetical protein